MEDGKDYGQFGIGKGIDVGETVKLNWDKSTNKSGSKWYLKAVYGDKPVGEAVGFDFCEEDLVIDFKSPSSKGNQRWDVSRPGAPEIRSNPAVPTPLDCGNGLTISFWAGSALGRLRSSAWKWRCSSAAACLHMHRIDSCAFV